MRANLVVLTSAADIYLGPRPLVQPDLFVVRVGQQLKHIASKDFLTSLLAVRILTLGIASAVTRSKGRSAAPCAGIADSTPIVSGLGFRQPVAVIGNEVGRHA